VGLLITKLRKTGPIAESVSDLFKSGLGDCFRVRVTSGLGLGPCYGYVRVWVTSELGFCFRVRVTPGLGLGPC